jgi:hypothetical protein
MLNKYFVLLIVFAHSALATEANKQQQIEIILFKDNSTHIESDNLLPSSKTQATYKMHSYYEPQYQNLITSALSTLTFVNFENKAYSSVINQTVLAKNNAIIAEEKYLKYSLLNNTYKKLTTIKHKILQQKNNEIILHIAWKQDFDRNIEKKYLLDGNILDKTDDINETYNLVYGTITTKNSSNLEMKIDLMLDKDHEKHHFYASRRIKSGQLNYIDDDNYGMLILISNI